MTNLAPREPLFEAPEPLDEIRRRMGRLFEDPSLLWNWDSRSFGLCRAVISWRR